MLCARTYIPDCFVDLVAGIILPFVLPDFPFIFCARIKVSKVAKIRNRYNQVPHLTQDTNGKVTNSQKTPQTALTTLYRTTVCHCFQRYCGKPIFGKLQSVDFISLVIHFSDTYFDACHLQ